MNTPSPEHNNAEKKKYSSHIMRFGRHQVQPWAIYLLLGITTAMLSFVIYTAGASLQHAPQPSVAEAVPQSQKPVVAAIKHGATEYLINRLKRYGLWKVHPTGEVPRFFIETYPYDLNTIEDIAVKKTIFLHSLLPHALFVRQEALRKRDRLESILSKIDCSLDEINFTARLDEESQCSWSDSLTEDEVSFIQKLCWNYRTTTAEGLLERVDAVPTSLILAQGALESSWGSSRFAREGNSVFGMWTWKSKGLVPENRDEGKTHKVKVYENILDAVRAYQLTLNRLDPYDQFRQLRRHTDDSLVLAEGLTLYSERGEEYVEDIKNVILSNNLQKYDSYRLSDRDLPEFPGPVTQPSVVTESGKASL
jgi:Bax protein